MLLAFLLIGYPANNVGACIKIAVETIDAAVAIQSEMLPLHAQMSLEIWDGKIVST